jgi:peptide chain release factor subunit 1
LLRFRNPSPFFPSRRKFGAEIEFVTNKSQEGSQFVRGFGGIGAILRYCVDFSAFEEPDERDFHAEGFFVEDDEPSDDTEIADGAF